MRHASHRSRLEADRREELRERARWLMARDRMIHEPSKLAVVTILREQGRTQYLDLMECTGLSKGNLSNHLAKLENAELVIVSKHFEAKKPVTTVDLTTKGKATIDAYYAGMVRIAGEV